MTVQELIDALNKIEDKSKDVIHTFYCSTVEEVEERDDGVMLY